jgi:hypothetical protein
MTYVPGVARLLPVVAGLGPRTGEDVKMPKLRVGRSIGRGGAGKIRPAMDGPHTTSSTGPAEGHPGRTVAAAEVARRAGVSLMSPGWLRAFRPAWRALAGWPARTPVSHSSTGSSDRQPEPGVGVQGMSTAAGLGGGAACGGLSVAPPPAFPPPTATTDSRDHSERSVDAGQCARLRALSATLPSPNREIVLLWVAGVSVADIAAALGVTPAAIRLAQHQILSTLPPATAHGPSPATRQRVVLLPHARNGPTDIRPDKRRTAARDRARSS